MRKIKITDTINMTNTNKELIDKYSKQFPYELKCLLESMPRDDTDWALVLYLFEHTSKGNIITLGKISSYFGLEKDNTFERLNRMYWLINQYVTYEYGYKGVYIYQITKFGADALLKFVELLEIKILKDKVIDEDKYERRIKT